MKAVIKQIEEQGLTYTALMFVCPGCLDIYPGSTGLHMLPVNSADKTPSWEFDGNLETPTLSPSILTRYGEGRQCHSFLRNGKFQFLDDCSHSLAGQVVDIPDLPAWTYDRK